MAMNFNTQPYFDDFDSSKNFFHVLFKPSKPVQVRELNQLQSILHRQTEKFADHIFKPGSIITGQTASRMTADYVTIDDISPWNGLPITVGSFKGTTIIGAVSKISATIVFYVDKENTDPVTIYVKYTSSGIDGIRSTFIPGEEINFVDSNDIIVYSAKVRCPSCAESADLVEIPVNGKGDLWAIPEGTYYVYGYFVEHAPDIIIGEKYTFNSQSYTVGFDVVEDIVTAKDDKSLYDNTLGYPNYGAEGADRHRITLKSVKRSLDYTDGEQFVVLANIVEGTATYIKSKTGYSDIMKMIAERTYDESGNYTVNAFRLNLHDHLKRPDNNGLFTEDQGGDDSKFVGVLTSGRAYVKGYQVERISENRVVMEKARDTKIMRDFYNTFTEMSYVLIKLEPGSCYIASDNTQLSVFGNLKVQLYSGPASGGNPTGDVIGSLMPFDVEYYSGTGADSIYKLFFTALEMNGTRKFSEVQSMERDGTINFCASPVNDGTTNLPRIYNNTESTLIWKIADYVKSTRDADNSTIRSLSYTSRRKFQVILEPDGSYVWSAVSGEYYEAYNPLKTLGGIVEANGDFTPIDLTGKIVIKPTSITVSLGISNAGKKFVLFQNVMKSDAMEKTKQVKSGHATGITMNSNKELVLSETDLYKITSIVSYADSAPTVQVDVTDQFDVFGGQTDFAYIPIVLTWKGVYDAAIRFNVEYQFFEHSQGDFFSIDSYNPLVNDPNIDFTLSDIPTYTSKSKIQYKLRDSLDFRPRIMNTNPVNVAQPALSAVFSLDLEYYLPRIDLLIVNSSGEIKQKKGTPADAPAPPRVESDGSEMAIYEIHQKPFVDNLQQDVQPRYIQNKRYTMRDIGAIEARINRLEYYTTFTLMEMDLAQTSVKDQYGLDRFKNGFLAENFQNFQASDIGSNEFRASLDRKDKTLRPSYGMFETGFNFNTTDSTNYKLLGDVALIDYTPEEFMVQPYATKDISVNPYYIFSKTGTIVMNPPYDNWVDINKKPNVTINMEMPPVENDNIIGKEYGNWKNVVSSTAKLGEYVTDVALNTYMRSIPVQFNAIGMTPATRVYCFFDDVDVTAHCRPLSTTAKYGDAITTDANGACVGEFRIPDGKFFTGQKTFRLTNTANNSEDPDLIRTSAEGIFWSGGLDYEKQERILNIITPIVPVPTTQAPPPPPPAAPPAPAPTVAPVPQPTTRPPVTQPAVAGAPVTTKPVTTKPPTTKPVTTKPPTTAPKPACFKWLYEASNKFGIPDPHHKESSTWVDPNSTAGKEALKKWSASFAVFGAAGAWAPATTKAFIIDLGKRFGITISGSSFEYCSGTGHIDPVAQSFIIEHSSFITGIDVYFSTVAVGDEIFFHLREMINGYPGPTVLAEKTLPASSVKTSNDSALAMHVEFPYPTYVQAGKEYCIVVGGKDPNTRVWICKLGDKDILTNVVVDTQPNTGSFFKSQNNTTWNASQYEDMKFKLYRARFKYNTIKFVLDNKSLKDEEYESNPFETEAGSNQVRVWSKGHAMLAGDTLRPAIAEKTWLNITSSTDVSIGQKITTATGSANITDFEKLDDGTCNVLLQSITGHFIDGQAFTTNNMFLTVNDEFVVNSVIGSVPTITMSKEIAGTINNTLNPSMNGIPFNELNIDLIVKSVDGIESFVVETTTPATLTGRTGGDVLNNANKRYDMFNISGSVLTYNSTGNWNFIGTGHDINGLFPSDNYVVQQPIAIELQQDIYLDRPMKISNAANESGFMSGSKSATLVAEFTTPNTLISPILNTKTFSMIGIHNTIDWNEESTYNVAPNALNRLIPETDPENGSCVYKYLSKDITLADPALDLRILVDVLKPQDSDFDIWIKTREPWSIEDIDMIPWVKVNNVWKDFISVEEGEYREVDVTLGDVMPEVFGENQFNVFKVKLTGRAKNTSQPVLFKMLRTIAVT